MLPALYAECVVVVMIFAMAFYELTKGAPHVTP
jgi:hypothetical protein